MNLIEAWNTAKEGQVINSTRIRNITKREGSFIKMFPGWCTCVSDEDMLGDDWEITKEKKTIVTENVTWYINDYSGLLTPLIDLDIRKQLLNKPPMKMTLEWKE